MERKAHRPSGYLHAPRFWRSSEDPIESSAPVKLVAGDGAPIGAIAKPLTPEPVTTEVETAVRDSAIAEFERLYGDPANPQRPDRAPPEFMVQMVAQMRADIEGMQFNHEIPVVLFLRATWEGGLWVRRRREGDPWEGAIGVRGGAARRMRLPG